MIWPCVLIDNHMTFVRRPLISSTDNKEIADIAQYSGRNNLNSPQCNRGHKSSIVKFDTCLGLFNED